MMMRNGWTAEVRISMAVNISITNEWASHIRSEFARGDHSTSFRIALGEDARAILQAVP